MCERLGLTPQEAADLLGVSIRTVCRAISRGEIAHAERRTGGLMVSGLFARFVIVLPSGLAIVIEEYCC
jgi:excisionase family DNA binding protein